MLALVTQAGRRVAAALTFRDFRLLWLGALSQGQMLCLLMMIAGAGFVWWRKKQDVAL